MTFDPSGTSSNPKYSYVFNATGEYALWNSSVGWFCRNYPDKTKNVVRAFPNNLIGHVMSLSTGAMWKTFGVNTTDEFFPAGSTDLSSLGTKVAGLNPTCFSCTTGDSAQDAPAYNAVYDAGYRGQFFNNVPNSVATLKQTLSPKALEGFICAAYATEFDPALTQSAKDFQAAWAAKNGEWTSPEVSLTSQYMALKTAFHQVDSIDTEKVNEVMAAGMQYDTLNGVSKLISRLDLGNAKTVDSVSTFFMKKLHDGKAELIGTVNLDEISSDFLKANPPLAPGATPPSGPPPGGLPPGGAPPG